MTAGPCPDFDELVGLAGSPVGIRAGVTIFIWAAVLGLWAPARAIAVVLAVLAFLWVVLEFVVVTGELPRATVWAAFPCGDVQRFRSWLFIGRTGAGPWPDAWLPRLQAAGAGVLAVAAAYGLLMRS